PRLTKWFESKNSASSLIDRSCSRLGLQRPRDAVTDASSRSANLNCAAWANPKKFLGCGSLRAPLCNSDQPDEITVRPESSDRDSDGIRGQCLNLRIDFLTRLLRCLATLPTLSAAAGNAHAA